MFVSQFSASRKEKENSFVGATSQWDLNPIFSMILSADIFKKEILTLKTTAHSSAVPDIIPVESGNSTRKQTAVKESGKRKKSKN